MTVIIGSLLTVRELARVSTAVTSRYPRDTTRTQSEYRALLLTVGSELYPNKVPSSEHCPIHGEDCEAWS